MVRDRQMLFRTTKRLDDLDFWILQHSLDKISSIFKIDN